MEGGRGRERGGGGREGWRVRGGRESGEGWRERERMREGRKGE